MVTIVFTFLCGYSFMASYYHVSGLLLLSRKFNGCILTFLSCWSIQKRLDWSLHFPRLFSTYNNNTTVLFQPLLRPFVITARIQKYITMNVLIAVTTPVEMCKIIPSLVHILCRSTHIIYLLMHSGRGLSQWPFGWQINTEEPNKKYPGLQS